MLDNKINSSSVETQQNQPEDSFDLNKMIQNSSNLDIANDHKKLKERITDLLKGDTEFSEMKQGDKALVVGAASGLFIAVLPLLAVGATLAIPGAIVGLALYFAVKVAVKAVQSGYKGLKWSAEKTVDGAKYTAGKVKDASIYTAEKVKDASTYAAGKIRDGYERSADSLKRSASFVSEGVADKFHKAAGETDYLDKIKRFTQEEIEKSDDIRKDMKAIFADKGNNAGLIKDILSGISSKIDSKIAEEAKSGWMEHTSRWQVQKEFISNLNEKSLHSLLTQKSLPKGSYFIDRVFSEHHDEIKEVIAKCKEDHILKGSLKMRSNMFEEGSAKPSRSLSFSLLGRKNSEQSNSLSRSNSLNSVKTDSTVSSEAELLNPAKHKEVKTTAPFKVPLWLGGKKAPEETTNVKYQVLSESDTLSRQVGKSTFYVAPPKPPRSSSLNSIGTGSTATVSDSDSQDFATVNPNLLRSNSSSSLNGSPKLTPVTPPKPPARGVSLLNLNELNASPQNSFSKDVLNDPIVKQNLDSFSNGTLTRSDSVDSLASSASDCSFKSAVSDHNGSDSGFNSPTSSPTHTVFTNEDGKAKAQADLKKTGHLNKLVGQPSTYTSKAYIELQQPAATQGATASK